MDRTLIVVVAAVVAIGAVACSVPTETTRVGGDAAPVVLRLGTPDTNNQWAAPVIDEFAANVEKMSEGTLSIEPVWTAGGLNVAEFDQEVARRVMSGDLDMGMIPARAWDTEGVTTLRALQAPFLVDSDELAEAIADGDVGASMLAGLSDVGVTGLALFPEEMRRVFSFGEPMVSPEDFEGRRVRVPLSATSTALFEALGATAVDISGDAFSEAVSSGEIHAAESAFSRAGDLPAPATAMSNAVLYPKLQTLVVHTSSWDDLTTDHREALTAAVAATTAWADGHATSDVEAARSHCSSGYGAVVQASDGDLQALRRAVRPVYADIERDEVTADLIARIQALKATLPQPPEMPTCEQATTPPDDEGPADIEDVDIEGVWRFEVTFADFAAQGIDRTAASSEVGVHTVTLEDGELIEEWQQPQGPKVCRARYDVAGDRVTFEYYSGCEAKFSATASIQGDRIDWSDPESLPPKSGPEYQPFDEAYNSVPWIRIGDVGTVDTD